MRKRTAIVLVAGAVVLLLVSLVMQGGRLSEPPGRDQGLFLTQADLVLQGWVPYRDFWEHKPPGLPLAYAVAMRVLGGDYRAVQLATWLLILVTAGGLVWVGGRAGGRLAGFTAALLYLLYVQGLPFGGYWSVAQAEVLMDLPVLLLLVIVLTGRARGLWLVLAGLLVGWAALLKYPAILLGIPLAVLVAVRPGPWRTRAIDMAWLALSGLVLPSVLAAVLGGNDALGAFWDATITFNRAHRAVSSESPWIGFPLKVFYRPLLLLPLYLGALVTLIPRKDIATGLWTHARWVAWTLWATCLVEIFWQQKFWVYHYHLVLLPLCLLAGLGAGRLAAWLRPTLDRAGSVAAALLAIALALIPYGRGVIGYARYHRMVPRLRGQIPAEASLATYTWGGPDYAYLETRAAAQRVERETRPEDTILVWGFEAEVYHLAGRRPASRFLYDYPLSPRFEAVHADYVRDLMADLEATPPALILVLDRDANDIESYSSFQQIQQLAPLRAYVERHYRAAWQQGDFMCLRRQ